MKQEQKIIQDLKKEDIPTILKKYKLTWKQLITITTQLQKPEQYINKDKHHHYIIKKNHTYYGKYKTKQEAQTIKTQLILNQWNKKKLPEIYHTTQIQPISKKFIQK